MSSSPPVRSPLAFTFHAFGAVLLLVLVSLLVFDALFSPVDLFVHHNYILVSTLRFAVAGFVFYGFSLALLRSHPLPSAWGVVYAASSWLLFVATFFPTSSGNSGMMRRIANPEAYEVTRRSLEQGFQLLKVAATLGFGLIQAAYLWYVSQSARSEGKSASATRSA